MSERNRRKAAALGAETFLHWHHVGASCISLAPTFFKSQSALIPLLLLSDRDSLRWIRGRFLTGGETKLSRMKPPDTSEQSPLCSDVLLFLRNKRTSSARSLAPPFRPRFVSPDSRSVFDRGRNENIRNEATCQKEMPPVRVAFLFGVLSICCVYPPAGVSQCGGLPAKPARRRPGQPPSAASHG